MAPGCEPRENDSEPPSLPPPPSSHCSSGVEGAELLASQLTREPYDEPINSDRDDAVDSAGGAGALANASGDAHRDHTTNNTPAQHRRINFQPPDLSKKRSRSVAMFYPASSPSISASSPGSSEKCDEPIDGGLNSVGDGDSGSGAVVHSSSDAHHDRATANTPIQHRRINFQPPDPLKRRSQCVAMDQSVAISSPVPSTASSPTPLLGSEEEQPRPRKKPNTSMSTAAISPDKPSDVLCQLIVPLWVADHPRGLFGERR